MPRTTNLYNKPPLGTLIANQLKELNKTQKWLAHETGLTISYISLLIIGKKNNPSVKALKKIADALGVSVENLVVEFERQNN